VGTWLPSSRMISKSPPCDSMKRCMSSGFDWSPMKVLARSLSNGLASAMSCRSSEPPWITRTRSAGTPQARGVAGAGLEQPYGRTVQGAEPLFVVRRVAAGLPAFHHGPFVGPVRVQDLREGARIVVSLAIASGCRRVLVN
jgi:hypothetical protein